MEPITIDEFDSMSFKDKLSYLYDVIRTPFSERFVKFETGKKLAENGCEYFLKEMEEKMDEKTSDYTFDFDILPKQEFESRFGQAEGICEKENLDIYLNETVLRDPEIFGGSVLFHERVTKKIKKEVGQLVPVLEECLAHRALLISLGAYEEIGPAETYDVLKDIFGNYLDTAFLEYHKGEKFEETFRFVTSKDRRNGSLSVILDYIK